jgi:hypothetical protein
VAPNLFENLVQRTGFDIADYDIQYVTQQHSAACVDIESGLIPASDNLDQRIAEKPLREWHAPQFQRVSAIIRPFIEQTQST